MTHSFDQQYFTRRAEEETRRGMLAAHPKVVAVHFELALRYFILAADQPPQTHRLTLVSSGPGRLAA